MALATLSIDLTAKLAKFEQNLDKASRVAERRAQQIERSMKVARTAVLSLGAAATAALAALQFRDSVNLLDSLSKLNERTGVSVETLSALRYAGELADVSMETLGNGLRQLSIEMAKGNDAFDTLGVKTRDSQGNLRNTEGVLNDLADAFAGMRDGAGKTALAAEVLGRRYGPELLTLLNQGSKGLRENRQEAEQLGVVYETQAARQAALFNDQMSRLAKVAEAAKVQIATALLPTLIRLTTELVEGRKAYGSFADAIVDAGLQISPFESLNEALARTVPQLAEAERQLKEVQDKLADGGVASRLMSRGYEARVKVLQEEVRLLQAREQFILRMMKESDAGRGDMPSDSRRDPTIESEEDRRQRESAERAAAAARERAARAYDDLITRINARTNAAQFELETGQALTESQQFATDVVNRLASAELGLTEAQKSGAAAALERALQLDAELAKARDLAATKRAAADQERQQREASIDTLTQEVEATIRSNQALAEQIQEMGLTTEEVMRLRMARLQNAIAIEREQLVMAQNNGASVEEVTLRQRRIKLLEQELALRGQEVAKLTETADSMTVFAEQAAKNIHGALGAGVLDLLEGNFDNIADSFGRMLRQMAAQAIAADLGRLLLGDYGVNGSRRVGGLFGTVLSSIFHAGGVVGAGGGAKREVNPLVFAGAPRMHSGGLAGDEVPAILKRGEEVLPRNHPRHRANAGPTIVIHSTVNAGQGTDAGQIARLLDARDAQLKAEIADSIRRNRWGAVMA